MTKFEGYVLPLQLRTLLAVSKYLKAQYREREVKRPLTFNAETRTWLIQYLWTHPRRPQRTSLSWRLSLTYAMLIAALLVTGTAKAQSALPGDILYGWKRTSEQAWVSLSPDPVGTNIILANRRLNEWIAVQKDPMRSDNASNEYFDALTKLQASSDAVTSVRILPVLKAHRQKLNDSGLSTTQLDNYLIVGANPVPGQPSNQVSLTAVVPPPTAGPIEAGPQPTKVIIDVAPPVTAAPTEIVPPATVVPTEIVPPATSVPTEVPTEVVPPATPVPTEVLPPATSVPTDVPPPATSAPTDVPPPATSAPTQAPPPPTDVPASAAPIIVPTDIPQTISTAATP